MEITKAEIANKNSKEVVIQWSGPLGFGQLVCIYGTRGLIVLDTEYLNLETIAKIFRALSEEDVKALRT